MYVSMCACMYACSVCQSVCGKDLQLEREGGKRALPFIDTFDQGGGGCVYRRLQRALFGSLSVFMCVCIYVCMYVCMYVCV
jgi:hypothetical protein